MKIYYAGSYDEISLEMDSADPKEIPPKNNLQEAIAALKEATDEKTLYIINDDQRPTPSEKILSSAPITRNDSILVATGAHEPPGKDFFSRFTRDMHIHDAVESPCTFYGETSNGNAVYLNSTLDKFENLVVINSVEPHYFAGFTGGRKSFLPGVARYETIERNHKLALDSRAQVMKLAGNPVHEEMVEICRMVLEKKDVFCINLVLNKEGTIITAEYGDILESFYRAATISKEISAVKTGKRYDNVITVAQHPMDLNLDQSHKAVENVRGVVKKNGNLILVSQCKDGLGHPSHYYDLLISGSPEEVFEKIRKGYKLGWHKTAKILEGLQRFTLSAVTEIDNALLKKGHIVPLTLADLEDLEGDTLLVPDGAATVPIP
jgi:nickel-dependent lactate racemase